jgi:hypothetical protein
MTLKRLTVRAMTGVVFSLLAFVPNNLITFAQFFSTTPLTGITDYPVAFAAYAS